MFKKATKQQSKLRAAFFAPSGSGKTFSALRVATGIGGPIAVIDTEHGSASKYADRFEFDVCDLQKADIDSMIHAIESAKGYNVLIIDSLSHSWQELLEGVDKIARAKYRGNTWSAWSEGTPKQKALINAILSYDGHIIATMRSKTEWQTDSEGGKTKPVRVGLAPEQGKGIEYEFDLLVEISTEHIANVIKDRTGKFQDKLIEKPGEDFGKQLSDWLSSGAAPAAKEPEKKPEQKPEVPKQPTSGVLCDLCKKEVILHHTGAGYLCPDSKAKSDGHTRFTVDRLAEYQKRSKIMNTEERKETEECAH